MLACYTQRVWICLVGSHGETFEVVWRISRGAQASRRQGAFEWHKTKVQQSTKTKGWLQAQQNVMILRITDPADNNRVAKKQEIGIHHRLVSRTQIGYLPEKLWTQKAFGKRKKKCMAPCTEPSPLRLNAKLAEADVKPPWVWLCSWQSSGGNHWRCVMYALFSKDLDSANFQKWTVIRWLLSSGSKWVFIAPQIQERIIPFFRNLDLGIFSLIDSWFISQKIFLHEK